MNNLGLAVDHEPPRRLRLYYKRIPSRMAVTKLARPSKCLICYAKMALQTLQVA